MKITVVIITLNEERNIERCLKSVEKIADEIIVVDSFSDDNTELICNKFNVRFIKQSWLGYAEQKNYANSLALNDWIFSIDADEELSVQLTESILKIKTGPELKEAYSLNRLNNYCSKWIKHSGWYPDKKVRLFNRKFVKWSGNYVHEVPEIADDFNIVFMKGDLLHYSYNSKAEHLKQTEKYAVLSAMQAYDKGKRSSVLKMIAGPAWRFFRDYFIKAGFLDGKAGFEICKISARSTYIKYKTLADLHNKNLG